jgi:hypothetical protein
MHGDVVDSFFLFLFTIAFIFVPLGTWKLVDIIIWVIKLIKR